MKEYKVQVDVQVYLELPVFAESPEEAMQEIKEKNIWEEIFPNTFLPIIDGSSKITGVFQSNPDD